MKNVNKKTVIAIVGPTASGKTSLAVELAKKYSTQDSASFVNGILAKVMDEYGIKK